MQRILVPTDFTPVAGNAVGHGLELAIRLHHHLCLLHVFGGGENGPGLAEANRRIRREQEECLTRCGKDRPVRIEALVREGNLFRVVNEVSAGLRPRLMILGTHGKKGLQHLYGSYALRMVLDAPCPVIVVHDRPFSEGYRRILLPVTVALEPMVVAGLMKDLARLFRPSVVLFVPGGASGEQEAVERVLLNETNTLLKKLKVEVTRVQGGEGPGLAKQVMNAAQAHTCDLVMAATLPGGDVTAFSLAEWTEQLMFNPHRLPVLFLGQSDLPGK
ncbi:MAG TPA: universal stress protein [Bacteroidales bacterium]|nr:universal stress protein [Bacteroidales bacterium]HPS61775.1 universal stress protein [Bacteroidales bacterium]